MLCEFAKHYRQVWKGLLIQTENDSAEIEQRCFYKVYNNNSKVNLESKYYIIYISPSSKKDYANRVGWFVQLSFYISCFLFPGELKE